jgi:hypothetical protein
MSGTTMKLLYWAPRVICIAFAAFLAIFALDVFSMPIGPGEKAVALMMHLIPSALVLVALAIVWRWEWVGAFLFPALAVAHLVSKLGELDLSAYVLIEAPLLLLGALFLFSWRSRQLHAMRSGQEPAASDKP